MRSRCIPVALLVFVQGSQILRQSGVGNSFSALCATFDIAHSWADVAWSHERHPFLPRSGPAKIDQN